MVNGLLNYISIFAQRLRISEPITILYPQESARCSIVR